MVAPFQQPTHIHIYYAILYVDCKIVYVKWLIAVVPFYCLEDPAKIFATATVCNSERNSLSEFGFMTVNVSSILRFFALDMVDLLYDINDSIFRYLCLAILS
jgi:hypothetical protein